MAIERMWTVARYPDGSWTYGGKPDSPDYDACEVFRVLAFTGDKAVKKAQAKRYRENKRKDAGAAQHPSITGLARDDGGCMKKDNAGKVRVEQRVKPSEIRLVFELILDREYDIPIVPALKELESLESQVEELGSLMTHPGMIANAVDGERKRLWEEMKHHWHGEMGPAYLYVKEIETLFKDA